MTDEKPRVIIIPPKPELQQAASVTKQLRVAAYCRVSTEEEEQLSSYEAQCKYYTDSAKAERVHFRERQMGRPKTDGRWNLCGFFGSVWI